ncbi:hypothetical protein LguiA_003205 [Lonicera macranthoides]
MGRQEQEKNSSLRSKAAHLVSDITTVLLNPISDHTNNKLSPKPNSNAISTSEDEADPKRCQLESISEEPSGDLVDGPDTSSFTAFLYSLLSTSEAGPNSNLSGSNGHQVESESSSSDAKMKERSGKRSLLSRGKQSLGKALTQAARLGGYRNQASAKGKSGKENDFDVDRDSDRDEGGIAMQTLNEPLPSDTTLPETSEPSLLMSERTRGSLYASLPALAQGRKWVLLYSTWRNGISLSTLYRRSMFCPGLSLLVVGDRKGAVFGGLVEAPLKPTNKKRYQGTNNTFVFTNIPGQPVIFRPTGLNRYFTLCANDYLALGGGNHFALYLDGDLLNGSSSASETYGNSCLAHTEDFEVKEIELWGFVYASKFEEMISILRTEAPGICRW